MQLEIFSKEGKEPRRDNIFTRNLNTLISYVKRHIYPGTRKFFGVRCLHRSRPFRKKNLLLLDFLAGYHSNFGINTMIANNIDSEFRVALKSPA